MKRVFTICAIVALLLFATTLVTDKAAAGPQGKTVICHVDVDEGGPSQTIEVANSALDAHLTLHGDTVGPCQ